MEVVFDVEDGSSCFAVGEGVLVDDGVCDVRLVVGYSRQAVVSAVSGVSCLFDAERHFSV